MSMAKAVPSLALVLIGSMDWLTTIIGITCFGAVESNPFVAGIAGAGLPAFTAVKLSVTALVGLLFYQAERMLLGAHDSATRSYQCTNIMLKGACVAAAVFLSFAVVNNLLVIASAI